MNELVVGRGEKGGWVRWMEIYIYLCPTYSWWFFSCLGQRLIFFLLFIFTWLFHVFLYYIYLMIYFLLLNPPTLMTFTYILIIIIIINIQICNNIFVWLLIIFHLSYYTEQIFFFFIHPTFFFVVNNFPSDSIPGFSLPPPPSTEKTMGKINQ